MAASARLDAEKRAKAAEARLNGGVKKDEEDEEDFEDGQWEFEEEEQEDKPEMVRERYGEDEKEWLRNEIRGWENEINDAVDTAGRYGGGSGRARGGSKRKGKSSEDEGDEELTEADKKLLAQLEKKYDDRQGGSGSNVRAEDSDDDIIIVEPKEASTSLKQKKKAKVSACCQMPARFGWTLQETSKSRKKGKFPSSFNAYSIADGASHRSCALDSHRRRRQRLDRRGLKYEVTLDRRYRLMKIPFPLYPRTPLPPFCCSYTLRFELFQISVQSRFLSLTLARSSRSVTGKR